VVPAIIVTLLPQLWSLNQWSTFVRCSDYEKPLSKIYAQLYLGRTQQKIAVYLQDTTALHLIVFSTEIHRLQVINTSTV
jgi:hypothetical protein